MDSWLQPNRLFSFFPVVYGFVNFPSTILKALPFALGNLNPTECITRQTCRIVKTQKKIYKKLPTFQGICTPLQHFHKQQEFTFTICLRERALCLWFMFKEIWFLLYPHMQVIQSFHSDSRKKTGCIPLCPTQTITIGNYAPYGS